MKDFYEIKQLRRPREKHFLKKDGTMFAEIYAEDIHYFKNGKYEEMTPALNNQTFQVTFEEMDRGNILLLESMGHFLSIAIKDGKKICPKRNGKEVVYEDLLEGIDFKYHRLSNQIKEVILLKQKEKIPTSIIFTIHTDLELTMLAHDKIAATDLEKNIFVLEAPYMIDQAGRENHNIYYQLQKQGEIYELSLHLDTEWLQDALFPVIVDPTITGNNQDKNVYDTYIYPGDTGIDRNSSDYLKIGVEKEENQTIVNRALIKFELPEIGTGSQIISAQANLVGYPWIAGYQKTAFDIHRITKDWNEESADWNTMHDQFDKQIEGWVELTHSGLLNTSTIDPRVNEIDITNMVKQWYSGVPNYGFMIKAHLETYSEEYPMIRCFSKNNHIMGANPKPVLVIHYRNQNGLENYMDYQEQEFEEGSSYVNLYNGNMVGVFTLGKTIGGAFPVELNLVYNTNDVILNHDYGYGLGYQLNLYQTLKEVTLDNITLLEYRDEDGTSHYFYKGSDIQPAPVEGMDFEVVKRDPNAYYDEDGLSLVITKESDQYFMKDNDGNTSKFIKRGEIWYLYDITDTEQTHIQIEYDTSNRIVRIIDGSEQEITLTYEPNQMTIHSTNETTILSYQNNQPIRLTSKKGVTYFSYHTPHIIEKITDVTGTSIQYEYYDTIPYRMKRITEYGLNQELGNSIELKYGFHTTTLVDHKGNYNTYTFNQYGNTVGITSLNPKEEIKDAYGKSFVYGSKNIYTTSFGSMNKILTETGNVKVVKNYITNPSFETDTNIFTGSSVAIKTGKRSLKISENAKCSISVPKGAYYTLSAYMRGTKKGILKLSYQTVSGMDVEETTTVLLDSEYKRDSVTIYYPEDAKSLLTITLSMESGGMGWIDDIQLEQGEVANLYNLIENSDFQNGIGDWEILLTPRREGYELEEPAKVVTFQNGSTALKVHGDPYFGEVIQKEFLVSGKAGDTYHLCFWYKNTGMEETAGPTANKKVLIGFDYGETEDPHCFIPRGNFTANQTEWQFFEETFRAEYDYSKFTITIFNDCNVNDLYLTNFALFPPIQMTSSYEYDEDGNMTSMSDPHSGPKELSYNENNQLIQMMDVKGSNFTYEYDNIITDRILRGVSATGISNEIEYDTYGNPKITRIYNKNKQEFPQSIPYYIRQKGTKKYIDVDFIKKLLTVKENTCSHDAFILEKVEENLYKIVSVLDPRYSFYQFQGRIILSKVKASLFELVQNKNGSYKMKWKESNETSTQELYITVEDNHLKAKAKEETASQEFYFEEQTSNLFIDNKATYTEDGKFITSTKDTLGNITTYDIDPLTGLTKSITDAKENTTYYTYNDKEQMIKVEKAGKEVQYEYNNQNLLSNILHGTKNYSFTYDNFLNTKTINLGNQNLITHHYEERNGNLLSSTYGNNHTISYLYDDFDRIKKITKMNDNYFYDYDNLGNLSKIETNAHQYRYYYDIANRLENYQYDNFTAHYSYDEMSNVKEKSYKAYNKINDYTYEYNKDGAVTKVMFQCDKEADTTYSGTLNYTYDELGRITQKKLNDQYQIDYHYITKGNRTSFILDTLTIGNDKFQYTYDKLYNITDIYFNHNLINHYEYDSHNELLKDDDYRRNITTIYSYDNGGNLLSKKEYTLNTETLLKEDLYEYSNSNWEDQLTKFNHETITYDEIGNPLTIGNKILNWINGRQLSSISDNQNTITYEYDKDSIRTKKTVNGVTTKYYLENNHILFEETNGNMIYYIRDDENHLIGFRYQDETYYYLKNAQEDIIGILDSEYNKIANYQYDAWGKLLSVTDNNGIIITDTNHIAIKNPFRYRSYYYDSETKLYYLNSRYYNPNWGRFLNADSYGGEIGNYLTHNNYSYVMNNSISDTEVNGFYASSVLGNFAKGLADIIDELKYIAHNFTKTVITKVAVGAIDGPLPIADVLDFGLRTYSYASAIKPKEKVTVKKVEATGPIRRTIKKPCTTAKISGGDVKRGTRLTIMQSVNHVNLGGNVMCDTQIDAFKVAAKFNINPIFHEPHKNRMGYYPHYHPDKTSHRHIWFYSI